MSKNHALFLDVIKNEYEAYAICINIIKKAVAFQYDQNINYNNWVKISLKQYSESSISPNKLEEPINDKNIESSISDIDKSLWTKNLNKYFWDIHFHVRIHYSNSSMGEYLSKLHYLAMLLIGNEDLIDSGRLSVFLVPSSGDTYPFMDDNGEIDTQLYELTSTYLRVLINADKKGVIYGVAEKKTSEKLNIVKALDFKINSPLKDCFPVIVFRDKDRKINDVDEKIQTEYIEAPKVYKKKKFDKKLIPEIDHYTILFRDGVIKKYIENALRLTGRLRFGYANDRNPDIALADFVFETSFYCIKNKLTQMNWCNIDTFFKKVIEALGDTNIFSFSVFAFLFKAENNVTEKSMDFNIRKTANLSTEVTQALNQLIQNALQYSSKRVCVVTLLKENKEKTADETEEFLKIVISDLSDKTLLESFYSTINLEAQSLKRLLTFDKLKSLKTAGETISRAHKAIIENIGVIRLKNLFNDFEDGNSDIIETWYKFRQADSSAHIGLAIFSHIMEKSESKFTVISNKTSSFDSKNYYCNYNGEKSINMQYAIPGTEFNIYMPIRFNGKENSISMAQLNLKSNYYDNYNTYAKFLDSSLNEVKYENHNFDDYRKLFKTVQSNFGRKDMDKFKSQMLWTHFWLCIININQIKPSVKFINNIDFGQIINKIIAKWDYVKSGKNREIIIKGLMNALGVFCAENASNEIYIAITNMNSAFLQSLREVIISLAIKQFPTNLQLFLSDINSETQIHLFGSSYGEAIQNAYSLSVENGVSSFENDTYRLVAHLASPFLKKIKKIKKDVFIVPFTMFLKASHPEENPNMFFEQIMKRANGDITKQEGYKLKHTHIRLGNKVHTDQFYEMSFLFYQTSMANRVAFSIIKKLAENTDKLDIKNDNILFYGYASYSQAILMSITSILKLYRQSIGAKNTENITYAVYQYNLQSEANADNIKIYYKDENSFRDSEDIKVVQIVPISSTLTTFSKMWIRFLQDPFSDDITRKERHQLAHNHTVLWVRDTVEKKLLDLVYKKNKSGVTDIEEAYYTEPKDGIVDVKFKELVDCSKVHYILTGQSFWELPEKCSMCYPEDPLNEVPLIETDPSSTVPSHQMNMPRQNRFNINLYDNRNNERLKLLRNCVHYGHVKRGKNHYQYYIDTQKYFAKASTQVQEWLKSIRTKDIETNTQFNVPCLNIIFSPEHNTNVGFSQYVNAYYFNGTAEIISINVDKEFRSNFICEHAALKNTIERLFCDFYIADRQSTDKRTVYPVKFYFADDDIITGTTYRKASNLLQSLIPKDYMQSYGTEVFDKCFFLVDRISDSSKSAYVLPIDNFYLFCHIDISNMRKHGDSCVGCKLLKESEYLLSRSATRFAANYWSKKVNGYRAESFEEIIKKTGDDKAYYNLVISHMLKNLFKYNNTGESEIYYDIIVNVFRYFTNASVDHGNEIYKCIDDYIHDLLGLEYDRLYAIKCLIKIVSRPFITYNHSIKSKVLRFFILVSETALNDSLENGVSLTDTATETILKVLSLFKANKLCYLKFMLDYVFEALMDLHSTYLIRKNTFCKVLYFVSTIEKGLRTNNVNDNVIIEAIKNFWLTYSVLIQKIVDSSSDETRTLWLEQLLIFGTESGMVSDTNDNSPQLLSDRIVSNKKLEEYTRKGFELFCKEIFLANGHLLLDGLKQMYKEGNNSYKISDKYFMKRWKEFRKIDSLLLTGNRNSSKELDYAAEKVLYKHLIIDNGNIADNVEKGNIIKKRYDSFLNKIKCMIIEKYSLANQDSVRLAILTNSNESSDKLRDFEMISYSIENDNRTDISNAKYIIKTRVMQAVKAQDAFKTVKQNGYYMSYASDIEENAYNESQNRNNAFIMQDHRKPYFIICFDNTSSMLCADEKLRKIVPVYLYVSIIISDSNTRRVMPWLIMRDILSYRNAIMKYLVADFTSDAIERYAHSLGTSAILEHEKVISHSPMSDDKDLLKLLNYPTKKSISDKVVPKLDNGTVMKWVIARNYCNTIIAKLYNRVFRNINKSFDEIISDGNTPSNRDVIKLYVKYGYWDGSSYPIEKMQDILPNADRDNENDPVFKLFHDIITFKGLDNENLKNAHVIVQTDSAGNKYTYNRDYMRCIIYRIGLDALRFSYGAGAEKNDFLSRIIHHYEYNEKSKLADSQNGLVSRLFAMYKDHCACEIEFDIEHNENETSDFDWLVIKNCMATDNGNYELSEEINKVRLDKIKYKLYDPLDYSEDGHMSLVTEKEFLAKLFDGREDNCLNENMFLYERSCGKEYFITKLPIIRKGDGSIEKGCVD